MMLLAGKASRFLLLFLCLMLLGTGLARAGKMDRLYFNEFLRLTETSAFWKDIDFIKELDAQIQLLAYDGLAPHHYSLADLQTLEAILSTEGILPFDQRYEVAASYLEALADLHYGPTLLAGLEPYLIYPEGKKSLVVDPGRILNMALSGLENPADAFDLARPQYLPYQQLRAAYQFSLSPQWAMAAVPVALSDEQYFKIQINLERFRRLSHMVSDQLLLVDIAGAELALYDGEAKPIVRQSSQIGRIDRQTPLLWSEITHITVNPSWTVPPTVYREDILPQIRRNQRFLEENQMQVLNFDGQPMNPALINWRNPGRILLRQAPGDQNELGQIVVRFPNNEAIFLHDTPSQSYFSQPVRALSSGCIRLQEAPALARWLLAVSNTDQVDRLEGLLSSGATQELFLDRSIPVLLAYWTVEVDAEMGLHFRPDIYELDTPMLDFFKDRVVLAGR